MRVVVMGAGAVGGYLGGCLSRAGEDVTFVARGAHLEAMRARGLTIKPQQGDEFTLPVKATDEPAEAGMVDLVLFCVKTYDLEPAAERIRPNVGPDTAVLPVQNGIDIAERLGRIVGPGAVLGGVAWTGGSIEAPGVIRQRGLSGRLLFGELAGGTSPRTERLQRSFERAGLGTELLPDIRAAMWEKFTAMCANGGVTGVTRLPTGPLFALQETRDLYRGVMEEVVSLARASGTELPPDCVDRLLATIGNSPSFRASLANDLLAGRRLEVDSLNGTVVRLGRERGIPTPLNFAIYAALKPYADGAPTEV